MGEGAADLVGGVVQLDGCGGDARRPRVVTVASSDAGLTELTGLLFDTGR